MATTSAPKIPKDKTKETFIRILAMQGVTAEPNPYALAIFRQIVSGTYKQGHDDGVAMMESEWP